MTGSAAADGYCVEVVILVTDTEVCWSTSLPLPNLMVCHDVITVTVGDPLKPFVWKFF